MTSASSKKRTICFVPYKRHLTDFIADLSHHEYIHVIKEDFDLSKKLDDVVAHPCAFSTLGLMGLSRLLSVVILPPIYIKGLLGKLAAIDPDVIVVFDFYHYYALQVLHFKKASNKTVQIVCYSETRGWPRNPLTTLLLKLFSVTTSKFDIVCTYTKEGFLFIRRNFNTQRLGLIPAPVDTEVFYSLRPQRRYYKDGYLHILMNARFDKGKRHKDLFNAIKQLKNRGVNNIKISLVSREVTGRDAIRKCLVDMELTNEVTLLDTVATRDAMRELYLQHDVLILPSEREAIGMVVPEAMACGLATITSDAVGANTYVKENETGYIFPSRQIDALVLCIQRVNDAEVLERFGKTAQRTIEEDYSLSATRRHFLDMIFVHDDKNNSEKRLEQLSR